MKKESQHLDDTSFIDQNKDIPLIPEFTHIDPNIVERTFSAEPTFTAKRSKEALFYIKFVDLNGVSLTYPNPEKSPYYQNSIRENLPFYRYRLIKKVGNCKYIQPQKSPIFPFLTGFQDFKDVIDWHLPIVMVEGEKKAYYLCSKGIPAIGITGINGFFTWSKQEEKYKFPNGWHMIDGLIELLNNHEPGLVLLHDSDALDGSRQRRASFYGSAKAFYLLFNGRKLSYSLVDPSLGQKGIDEALHAYPEKAFSEAVQHYPLNSYEELAEVRKLFFKPTGAVKWDTLVNILDEMGIKFRWNVLRNLLEYSDGTWQTVSRIDSDIVRRMELAGVKSISVSKIHEMLRSSEISEPYNAIDHFFNNLPAWDGTNYIENLCKFIEKPDDEDPAFFAEMLRKHLIRTVRCALESENVNRIVLVLYGPQNIGKTMIFRFLVPSELYVEERINVNDKDSEFLLSQYLVSALDELDEMTRSDLTNLKSFISKGSIKQRLPYGRSIQEFDRVCSFVGSTNKAEILSDDKNTRWMVLKVKSFDWLGYTKAIDPCDIWSQAFAQYSADHASGELSANEKVIQAKRNEQFLVNSIERELLEKYFEAGNEPYILSEILKILNENYYHKYSIPQLSRELKRAFGEPVHTRENRIFGKYYYLHQREVQQVQQLPF